MSPVGAHEQGIAGLSERGAGRVARLYTTFSMAYEAIVRTRRRVPLFEELCRVLVEQGRVRMAWVGHIADDGCGVPVAHAGTADGYVDDLRVSVRDVAEGSGPAGIAVRECHRASERTDRELQQWRQQLSGHAGRRRRARSGCGSARGRTFSRDLLSSSTTRRLVEGAGAGPS